MTRKIPLNRLSTSDVLRGGMLHAVKEVIDRGWFIHGPEHAHFENSFAEYCGASHCVAVANGTDALEIAFRAVGIGAGDEVILQANAGFYSATALLAIGAVPVYADIRREDHQLDAESVLRCLSSRCRGVIMTHLYGKMGDVATLREICDDRKIPLIEDCAQAHGAVRQGRKAGAWGDVAAFSFYPTKNLGALGDGGAVVTSSQEIAEEARRIRQYGWSEKYRVSAPGRNTRLDEIQAAILNLKLPLLDHENAHRREIVGRYHRSAQGEISLLHGKHGEEFVGHLAVAKHPDRNHAMKVLTDFGIETAIHYPIPDHQQPCMESRACRRDALQVTENEVGMIFTLPCHPGMTKDEVNQVCEGLSKI